MFKRFFRYMDEAPADGGEGGAAPIVEPGAPAAPAAGSVLDAVASTPVGIPEKYQVKLEDGTIDQDASVAKLAEAYAHAEKRIGSGDLPPKAATEYEVKVPEALAGVWDTGADTLLDAFKDKAFAAGMTQAQFDLVIDQYGQIAPGLVAGNAQLSAEESVAALREAWKTPDEFNANVASADRAVKAYGGEDAETIFRLCQRDPVLTQVFARIGKEVDEDHSLEPGQQLGGDTIEALLASDAYKNSKDPAHAAVSAKVSAYYASQAAKDAKAGGAPIGL